MGGSVAARGSTMKRAMATIELTEPSNRAIICRCHPVVILPVPSSEAVTIAQPPKRRKRAAVVAGRRPRCHSRVMLRPGPRNLITDIDGIRVGNAEDHDARTGVTVILPTEPAVA